MGVKPAEASNRSKDRRIAASSSTTWTTDLLGITVSNGRIEAFLHERRIEAFLHERNDNFVLVLAAMKKSADMTARPRETNRLAAIGHRFAPSRRTRLRGGADLLLTVN